MVKKNDRLELTVLLDSGAFSAWKTGAVINIKEYCDFIEDNADLFWGYVALDVIPGAYLGRTTQAQAIAAEKQSIKNYDYMLSRGLKPIPVFHEGDDRRVLDHYLDKGATYVGISPRNPGKVRATQLWFDTVWPWLVDSKGKPIVDTHAFGLTVVRLVLRYPWTSVDSRSWEYAASVGNLFLPRTVDGEFCYTGQPQMVTVTHRDVRKQDKKRATNFHAGGLGKTRLDQLKRYLRLVGTDLETCAEKFDARCAANLYFFSNVAKEHKCTRFDYKPGGLGI